MRRTRENLNTILDDFCGILALGGGSYLPCIYLPTLFSTSSPASSRKTYLPTPELITASGRETYLPTPKNWYVLDLPTSNLNPIRDAEKVGGTPTKTLCM